MNRNRGMLPWYTLHCILSNCPISDQNSLSDPTHFAFTFIQNYLLLQHVHSGTHIPVHTESKPKQPLFIYKKYRALSKIRTDRSQFFSKHISLQCFHNDGWARVTEILHPKVSQDPYLKTSTDLTYIKPEQPAVTVSNQYVI